MTQRLALGIIGLSLVLTVIASARGFAGAPFITDDPEPVDYGHWEIDGFSAGAPGRGDTSGLGPSFEVNYGVLPNLQLHALGGLGPVDTYRSHRTMAAMVTTAR